MIKIDLRLCYFVRKADVDRCFNNNQSNYTSNKSQFFDWNCERIVLPKQKYDKKPKQINVTKKARKVKKGTLVSRCYM